MLIYIVLNIMNSELEIFFLICNIANEKKPVF